MEELKQPEQKICKKCLIREMDPQKFKEELAGYIEKLHEKDRADDALYDKRLSVCKTCEKLNQGTCLMCGCYVEIRAAAVFSRCPKRKW